MSKGEKHLKLIFLDDSNYVSWCKCIPEVLKVIGPILSSIVDISIYPPNLFVITIPMRKENAYNGMLKLL
jgi:hypothetical protein